MTLTLKRVYDNLWSDKMLTLNKYCRAGKMCFDNSNAPQVVRNFVWRKNQVSIFPISKMPFLTKKKKIYSHEESKLRFHIYHFPLCVMTKALFFCNMDCGISSLLILTCALKHIWGTCPFNFSIVKSVELSGYRNLWAFNEIGTDP